MLPIMVMRCKRLNGHFGVLPRDSVISVDDAIIGFAVQGRIDGTATAAILSHSGQVGDQPKLIELIG